MNPFANANTLWGHVVADELARCGLREAIITPGSRSTPLVLALAAHPDIRDISLIDERSAAFFAIGSARATGRPAALVCTSGTAVANYLPAICEADASQVPLIVLSADRPASLQDAGDSQAMNQIEIFGGRVRWFHNVELPQTHPDALRYLRAAVDRAVSAAQGDTPGPVHLNFPFRKPLEPVEVGSDHRDSVDARSATDRVNGNDIARPQTHVLGSVRVAKPAALDEVASALNDSQRPVILVGHLPTEKWRNALINLSNKAKISAWVEAGSNARFFAERPDAWIAPDALLSVPARAAHCTPDLLLMLGRWPINWPVKRWLESFEGPQIRLATTSEARSWIDPVHAGSTLVVGDLTANLEALARRVQSVESRKLYTWHEELNQKLRQGSLPSGVYDGRVAAAVVEHVPEGSALVVSSSMPLREVEAFGDVRRDVRIVANRGLNGIDGVVSTALGVASTGCPTTVLIGDVAFAHDAGALAGLLRPWAKDDLDLTVVVVNNGGGAIFDHLPLAKLDADASDPEAFDRHFRTTVDINIESLARAYGLDYEGISDEASLDSAIAKRGGPRILEVKTSPERSRAARKLWLERPLEVSMDVWREAESTGASRERSLTAEAPVVALHGFTGNPADFELLERHLDRSLTTPNLRGHAGSPAPHEAAAYTMQAYVDDVLHQLDHRGIERFHLLGYSMGGRISIALALNAPERVVSLATIGATAGIEDPEERDARQQRDEALARSIVQDGLHAFVDQWMQHPVVKSTSEKRGLGWTQNSRDQRLQGAARGYANALLGAGQGSQPSYWKRLDELAMPALFVAGREDTKFSEIARRMAEQCPSDVAVELVEDAGHAAHLEAPGQVAAILKSFWETS